MYVNDSDWDDVNYGISDLKKRASRLLKCKKINFHNEDDFNDFVDLQMEDLRR